MDSFLMMERERVLKQSDQKMAQINHRDSLLRGRGISMRLGAGQAKNVDHFKSLGIIESDDLLLDGADESSLLTDFEKHMDSNLVSFEEAMQNDMARDSILDMDGAKMSITSSRTEQPPQSSAMKTKLREPTKMELPFAVDSADEAE